jgi:ABC-2 type transport system permease protein
MSSTRGMAATLRGAFAEAAAKRAALASQMAVMIVNDIVWVVFWTLFFDRTGEVRGWDGHRVLMLLSVICTAAGLSLGVLANARQVGNMAVDGELDGVLALPVPPLAYLLLRRIEPVNLGDLVFGICLFVAVGHPTPLRVVVYVAVVLASAALMTGFLVLSGSLAFFAGRSETGELGFHAVLMTSAYPIDMFAGLAKMLLYSVIPAAFVGSVPAGLVEDFDAGYAAWLAVTSAGFAFAGWAVFTLGLRRYTSGSVWTRA